jgi:hypothetical protein
MTALISTMHTLAAYDSHRPFLSHFSELVFLQGVVKGGSAHIRQLFFAPASEKTSL